jgi:hypothetical protein
MLVLVCVIGWAGTSAGQELQSATTEQQNQNNEQDQDLQKTRMALMRERIIALEAEGQDNEKATFGEEPVLRYNDLPRGVVDASLWILGEKGRPKALLVLEVYDNNTVMYEMSGTDNAPKTLQGPSWQWSPRRLEFDWTKIPVETPPGDTSRLRQRQLKLLSRDFTATEFFNNQTYPLRLMPQPIHEYEDKEKGILDGAVMVWAHGTNAEILMFVEARQDQDSPKEWVTGFSRLSTASLDIKYRQQDFWSSPTRVGDGYFSRPARLTSAEQSAFATQ